MAPRKNWRDAPYKFVTVTIDKKIIADFDKWNDGPRSKLVARLMTEWVAAEKQRQAAPHEGR